MDFKEFYLNEATDKDIKKLKPNKSKVKVIDPFLKKLRNKELVFVKGFVDKIGSDWVHSFKDEKGNEILLTADQIEII